MAMCQCEAADRDARGNCRRCEALRKREDYVRRKDTILRVRRERRRSIDPAVKRQRRHEEHVARRSKSLVRMRTRYAIKSGKLTKRPCESCGCDDLSRVQAHHEDYGKPFDVTWLCTVCHRRLKHSKYSEAQ